MSEASYESLISEINSFLSSMDADERVKMIEELKKILQKELMMTHADVPEMVCPRCGSTESIRYGKTRVGTQRWQCKECGAVRCHKPTAENGTVVRDIPRMRKRVERTGTDKLVVPIRT